MEETGRGTPKGIEQKTYNWERKEELTFLDSSTLSPLETLFKEDLDFNTKKLKENQFWDSNEFLVDHILSMYKSAMKDFVFKLNMHFESKLSPVFSKYLLEYVFKVKCENLSIIVSDENQSQVIIFEGENTYSAGVILKSIQKFNDSKIEIFNSIEEIFKKSVENLDLEKKYKGQLKENLIKSSRFKFYLNQMRMKTRSAVSLSDFEISLSKVDLKSDIVSCVVSFGSIQENIYLNGKGEYSLFSFIYKLVDNPDDKAFNSAVNRIVKRISRQDLSSNFIFTHQFGNDEL